MTYEELLKHADSAGITVKEKDISGYRGRICNNRIAIHKGITTISEKAFVLAEELGHYYTTSGDILDQSDIANRKQEQRARLWAYNEQIGLTGIIDAYEHHCQSSHDMADYLDVPDDYLLEAISCYHQKYGMCTMVDNYVIYFSPVLGVLKMN